jgi:hypothetical protein
MVGRQAKAAAIHGSNIWYANTQLEVFSLNQHNPLVSSISFRNRFKPAVVSGLFFHSGERSPPVADEATAPSEKPALPTLDPLICLAHPFTHATKAVVDGRHRVIQTIAAYGKGSKDMILAMSQLFQRSLLHAFPLPAPAFALKRTLICPNGAVRRCSRSGSTG